MRDCVYRNFMSYDDKSEREAAIKERFYPNTGNDNNNSSSSEVLLDVYSSHHVAKSNATYKVSIPGIGLEREDCIGSKEVVLALQESPEIVKYVSDRMPGKITATLENLVKSYLTSERIKRETNKTILSDLFDVSISLVSRPIANTNTDSGTKYWVTFEDGLEILLTCKDISNLLPL